MNEKKNLDRLFQEKFKDFEVAPPDFVWDNIREELQEKKKTRVIPLWLRLSGVAAVLLLGGLLTTLFFNDAENPAVNAPAVVIDNSTNNAAGDAIKASPATNPVQSGPSAAGTTKSANNTSSSSNDINITNPKTAVASGKENTTTINRNAASASGGFNTKNNNTANTRSSLNNGSKNAVAYDSQTKVNNKKNGKQTKGSTTNILQQGEAVAAAQSSSSNGQGSSTIAAGTPANTGVNTKTTLPTPTIALADEAVAAAKLRNEAKDYANNPAAQKTAINKNTNVNGTAANDGVAVNNTSKTNNNAGSDSDAPTGTNPANADASGKSNVIIDKNIPVTEAVAQVAVDSTKAVPENELEKLLQEKLKEKEDDKDKALAENESKQRWNIRPQVAPVFYNSLTDGSPINEQFSSNSKSYDNDLSYGLGIDYAVTDRISIRSGINSVNLSYATNDIGYYASLNNLTSNIGESKTANIVIQNPGDAVPETFLINGQPAQLVEGSMIQKTGYIEVPLEMSYALINRKFGIDVIGGFSTLFLNQNNVSVLSNTGMSTKVGEAENLNDIHFSTNVGVGFRYKFWDSFQASFEPTFKYQVNAYSRDAGNFKPYFIGLYSGISFSF